MKRKITRTAAPARLFMSASAAQLVQILTEMREIIGQVVDRCDLAPGDHEALRAGIDFLQEVETAMWNLQLNVNNDGRVGWPSGGFPQVGPAQQRLVDLAVAREGIASHPANLELEDGR